MKFTLLGTVYDASGKNRQGFRIYDHDHKKVMNVSEANMISVLNSNSAEVENIALENGKLVGTNGSLDRYTSFINTANGVFPKYGSPTPFVVLSQIGDVGYVICDFKGDVKKFPNNKVVELAEKMGIANGKLVEQDSVKYISSINGSYDVTKVARSKVGTSTGVQINIPISVSNSSDGTRAVEKHVGTDVQNIIAGEDVFKRMSPTQRNILKTYYVWYTVRVYKRLAKNIRLNIATTKAEALTELRGEKEWVFAGVWDAGFHGASKCQLGHALRYEYYAKPKGTDEALDQMYSKMDKNTVDRLVAINKQEQNPNEYKIIFGENCAADFFKIDPKDMASLIKTRKIMSEELAMISETIANDGFSEHMKGLRLFTDLLLKLGSKSKITDALGPVEGAFVLNFLANNIPLPQSLIKVCTQNIKGAPAMFFKKVFPEFSAGIDLAWRIAKPAIEDGKEQTIKMSAVEQVNNFFSSTVTMMNFVASNAIEGVYAYDPFDKDAKNKDEGRYNKKTRENRMALYRVMERGIDVAHRLGKKWNMEQITSVLSVAECAAVGMQKVEVACANTPGFSTSTENSIVEYLVIKRANEAYALNQDSIDNKIDEIKVLDILTDCFGLLYKHTTVTKKADYDSSTTYYNRPGIYLRGMSYTNEVTLVYKPLVGDVAHYLASDSRFREMDNIRRLTSLDMAAAVNKPEFDVALTSVIKDFMARGAAELAEAEAERVQKEKEEEAERERIRKENELKSQATPADTGNTPDMPITPVNPAPTSTSSLNRTNKDTMDRYAKAKEFVGKAININHLDSDLQRSIEISDDIKRKYDTATGGEYPLSKKQLWRVDYTTKKLEYLNAASTAGRSGQEEKTETLDKSNGPENTVEKIEEEAEEVPAPAPATVNNSNFKELSAYDGLLEAIESITKDNRDRYDGFVKNIAKTLSRTKKASEKQAALILKAYQNFETTYHN